MMHFVKIYRNLTFAFIISFVICIVSCCAKISVQFGISIGKEPFLVMNWLKLQIIYMFDTTYLHNQASIA